MRVLRVSTRSHAHLNWLLPVHYQHVSFHSVRGRPRGQADGLGSRERTQGQLTMRNAYIYACGSERLCRMHLSSDMQTRILRECRCGALRADAAGGSWLQLIQATCQRECQRRLSLCPCLLPALSRFSSVSAIVPARSTGWRPTAGTRTGARTASSKSHGESTRGKLSRWCGREVRPHIRTMQAAATRARAQSHNFFGFSSQLDTLLTSNCFCVNPCFYVFD